MFYVHAFRVLSLAAVLVLAGAPPVLARQTPVLSFGPDGWTLFTPSADTRIVYVSSSLGNNANGGTTQGAPKRTIAAGYALLRNGYPDWLVLKAGDVWSEGLGDWHKSGRSASEPMMVGSYGTGERPLLMTGTGAGLYGIANIGQPLSHIAITDMHFVNNGHNASGGGAVAINLLNSYRDFLVENCVIERYGGGITIQMLDPGQRPQDIRIRRTTVVDSFSHTINSHAEGCIIGSTDGVLIEECIFDHNGWLEDPSIPTVATMFNHNLYLQGPVDGSSNPACTNVVTRGNIVARAGSTGISQRCGGLSENNLCLGNPLNLGFGHGSLGSPSVGGIIRNNVVLDSRDINGDPRGTGIIGSFARNLEIYNNVVAKQTLGTGNVAGICIDEQFDNVNIHDNVVYKWTQAVNTMAPAILMNGTALGPIVVRNNTLQQPAGGAMIETNGFANRTFSGQRYYTSNTGGSVMTWGTTYPGWVSSSHETGSSFTAMSFPDANRDIRTYMTSLGRSGSVPEFLVEARLQSRANWRPEFTAGAVNNYIRAGFGVQTGECSADLNGDGLVNINDFNAFLNFYGAGDARANCDGSTSIPTLTVLDFSCFLNAFTEGCQ